MGKITTYSETSVGQKSNLNLTVVYFFNTGAN